MLSLILVLWLFKEIRSTLVFFVCLDQLHRLGLVWCERAAPPLLLADDSREGKGLWRDCLAIVRNLTLLNNHVRSGSIGGGGGGASALADGPGEDATARDSTALCDQTVVLDGEGVRSALRLAAHPVNAPAKELLALLESLVLRCVCGWGVLVVHHRRFFFAAVVVGEEILDCYFLVVFLIAEAACITQDGNIKYTLVTCIW